MNNKIQRFYILIFDNNVIIVETNLKHFYRKVIEEDIGFKMSLSTMRSRFLDKSHFPFQAIGGRLYYFQKIENDENKRLEIIMSKRNF